MSETTENHSSQEMGAFLDYSQDALAKIGEHILVRFTSALKTAQIFKANNLTFLQQLNLLYSSLDDVLRNEGEAALQFTRDTLFFNGVRIRFDFSTFQHFKFLADEFAKNHLSAVEFDASLQKDQLKDFLFLLAKTGLNNENPFEAFQALLQTTGINQITIKKMHVSGKATASESQESKRTASKVFFKSIAHLKEVFKREDQNKRIRMKTTRRLMQSLVNSIVDNESFMVGLTNLKNYDDYTLNHSVNVCILSVCLGRRLGLERKDLLDLGIASFFHDIGKLEIPTEILNKPGKLNDEEREIIERHPFLGAGKLVRHKELYSLPVKALYVALEHHLRADLSGYPRYWKKDSIDIYSRIVEICDFFDAVTTKRPYRKKAFTRTEALQMMLEKSGTEFDPVLLKVFASVVGIYPIGTLVLLDSSELGIVTEINPDIKFMLRPKVKLITDAAGNRVVGKTVDLSQRNPTTDKFLRTILKPLDPAEYDINVSDYFLAEAERPSI